MDELNYVMNFLLLLKERWVRPKWLIIHKLTNYLPSYGVVLLI